MRQSKAWVGLAMILALGALFMTGCSSAPPCETDPVQLDQARADLEAAKAASDQAAAEVEALESQIAELENKMVSDSEIAELERKLAELKKGSGR